MRFLTSKARVLNLICKTVEFNKNGLPQRIDAIALFQNSTR